MSDVVALQFIVVGLIGVAGCFGIAVPAAYQRGRADAFDDVRKRPATLSDETIEKFTAAVSSSFTDAANQILRPSPSVATLEKTKEKPVAVGNSKPKRKPK
jgi:hypothetical protein